MSIGHRALDNEELSDATSSELYRALGDRNTPELFEKPYKVDTDYDIPFGAGNSVDRKTIYIDRTLYQEVMDNALSKTGLTPVQIIGLWCEHEHTEKAIVDGDNPVDNYYPAHTRALRMEHRHLLTIVGHKNREDKIRHYEECIWPALVKCYHRDIKKPPKDLWCAPVLDDPAPRDEEIVEQFRRLGVVDAHKKTKYETHYQPGPRHCEDCRYWNPEYLQQQNGEMASCKIVNGLVRKFMHCDHFTPAKES
jgi:hypothetical protein